MTASEEQPHGQLFVGKGGAKPLPDRRSDPVLPENEPFLILEPENDREEGGRPEVEDKTATAGDPAKKDGSPEQRALFQGLPDRKLPVVSGGRDAVELRSAASLLPLKIHDRKKTKKLEFELTLTDRLLEDPTADEKPKAESGDLPAETGSSEAELETTQDSEVVAVAGMAEKPELGSGETDPDEEFTMVLPAGAKALARSGAGYPASEADYSHSIAEPEDTADETLARLPDHPEVTIIPEDRLNRKKAFLAAAAAAVALLTALGAYLLWGQSGSERRDLLVAREIVIPEDGSAAQGTDDAAPGVASEEASTSDSSKLAGQDKTAAAPEAKGSPGTAEQTGNATNPAAPAASESTAPAASVAGEPLSDTSVVGARQGQPVVDVVRLDPDGNVVIAGKAAPKADLIILDNNEPIGTAAADEFGEWVFVASHKLPPGRHEFGLVVKDVKGRVILGETLVHEIETPPEPVKDPYADLNAKKRDAAASDSQGGTEEDAAAEASAEGETQIPLPKPKPDTPSAFLTANAEPAAPKVVDYVIQLASVSSREGAESEWAKLLEAHKSLLRPLTLIVDSDIFETKFRVRTGPFEKIEEAGEICKALKSRGQDCLVVKRLDGID